MEVVDLGKIIKRGRHTAQLSREMAAPCVGISDSLARNGKTIILIARSLVCAFSSSFSNMSMWYIL